MVGGAISSPIDTAGDVAYAFDRHPVVLFSILLGLLVSSLMARVADGHISNVASEFWHLQKCFLREALQVARRKAAAKTALSAPQCWTSAHADEPSGVSEDGLLREASHQV